MPVKLDLRFAEVRPRRRGHDQSRTNLATDVTKEIQTETPSGGDRHNCSSERDETQRHMFKIFGMQFKERNLVVLTLLPFHAGADLI